MKLTKEIREAIAKTVDEMGSQRALSMQTGVSTQNISKYLTERIKTIREDAWKKMYPHIVRWLPSWPGGFPEDGTALDSEWHGTRTKIHMEKEKIELHLEDSDGITFDLKLGKLLTKHYYYMDAVQRSMFLAHINANIKQLLQQVSVDDKVLAPSSILDEDLLKNKGTECKS